MMEKKCCKMDTCLKGAGLGQGLWQDSLDGGVDDTSELFPCLPLLPVVSPDLALQCKRSRPSLRRASPPVLWTLECFSDTRRGARTGWVFRALAAQRLLSALCCRHTSGSGPPQDPHPPHADGALWGHWNITQSYTQNRPGHQTGRGEK